MANEQKAQELVKQLGAQLAARGEMMATAESCTGGWVSMLVTNVSGSSSWFDRGFVTYSNESKQEMLGVSKQVIEINGAVSVLFAQQKI